MAERGGVVNYAPELGQAVFGRAWGDCSLDDATNDLASDELRHLVRDLQKLGHDGPMGCLGGSDGYGIDFQNDVFEMHPYWWGDCTCGFGEKESAWSDAHDHAPTCYQTDVNAICYPKGRDSEYDRSPTDAEYRSLCKKHGLPWNGGSGCAVHCTCTYDAEWSAWRSANDHAPDCKEVIPNFRCGDIEIRWYKYIGRGMSVNRPVTQEELMAAFKRCRESLKSRQT